MRWRVLLSFRSGWSRVLLNAARFATTWTFDAVPHHLNGPILGDILRWIGAAVVGALTLASPVVCRKTQRLRRLRLTPRTLCWFVELGQGPQNAERTARRTGVVVEWHQVLSLYDSQGRNVQRTQPHAVDSHSHLACGRENRPKQALQDTPTRS